MKGSAHDISSTGESPRRIALFVSALHHGGAERVACNLANRWSDMGHHVCVINLAKFDTQDYVLQENVTRVSLNLFDNSTNIIKSVYANVKRIFALRSILKQQKTDTLLAFMTSSNVIGILATVGLPCKAIVCERNHPPRTEAASYWLILRKLLYRYADIVVVLARESKIWIEENTNSHNVCVVPNSIIWPIPQTDDTVNPEEHIAADRKVLLAVGRLVHQKGHPMLLEAFSNVVKNNNDWDLCIVGSGDQSDLNQLITDLALKNRVSLIGSVGNITDWYARADLFVLSSISEGFPNGLVEAMASGCAVVSFDCDTGPRDIIRHGVTGMLVEANNVPALSNTLSELMQDEQRRIELGDAATEVRKTYSPDNVLSLWSQLIKENTSV